MPTREEVTAYLSSKLSARGLSHLLSPALGIIGAESGFRADAYGTIAPGEQSEGLFQINMGSGLGASRAQAYFGITDVGEARRRLRDWKTNIDIAVDHFMAPRFQQAQQRGLGGQQALQHTFQPWSTAAGVLGGGGGGGLGGATPQTGGAGADGGVPDQMKRLLIFALLIRKMQQQQGASGAAAGLGQAAESAPQTLVGQQPTGSPTQAADLGGILRGLGVSR